MSTELKKLDFTSVEDIIETRSITRKTIIILHVYGWEDGILTFQQNFMVSSWDFVKTETKITLYVLFM